MISMWDWFDKDTPMLERYRLMKEVGFDGVLMWWSNEFGRDKFGNDDYLNSPKMAIDSGLFIENIHVPVEYANLLWEDSPDGTAIYNRYMQCIRDCESFEIPTMVVHLPNEDHVFTKLGLERMMKITELAEQKSINVALENLRNLSNLSYVLEKIDSNRIGFCYDSGHHYHYYPECNMLSKFGSRLMALHLQDDNGSHGMHGLPLDGSINWISVMKNIADTGYKGPTSLEPMKWAYEDMSVEEYLKLAARKARRLDSMRL